MDKVYIKTELESLQGKARAERAKELAYFYNVSVATIWRKANEEGLHIRKERINKGSTAITDEVLKTIAAQVFISKRLNGSYTNSVKKAYLDFAIKNDISVGYARVCSLLKERGLDKETLAKPTPHIQLMSKHPNQVWQFDVTNCLQWHFKNKTGLAERDFERLFYKNKVINEAKKIKQELLRFVIVDHCSGAFFFWYYYTSGERAEDGADFFYKAFRPKTELINNHLNCEYKGEYQINGVPFMLVSDKGSILKHKAMVNLFECLNVKIELHQAGNPRAKGMVEGLMKIIGFDFESDLKRHKVESLAELNALALKFAIERNCKYPFRQNEFRSNLWFKIKHEELRLCPEEALFKTLQHKPTVKRKVDGNAKISYEGRSYNIPNVNACNQNVLVMVNAYEYPNIDIHFDGKVYLCKPLEADNYGRLITANSVTYGEYKANKTTKIEKARGELEQIAYEEWGVAHKGNKQKRQALPTENKPTVVSYEQDNIAYLQKKGVEIITQNIHEPLTNERLKPVINKAKAERFIPVTQMIRMYVEEFGKLSPSQNKLMKESYPDGIPLNITLTDVYNLLNTEVENARTA